MAVETKHKVTLFLFLHHPADDFSSADVHGLEMLTEDCGLLLRRAAQITRLADQGWDVSWDEYQHNTHTWRAEREFDDYEQAVRMAEFYADDTRVGQVWIGYGTDNEQDFSKP